MNSGYTLLELLMVVLIMGILVGLGAAGYRDFSRRQYITTAKQSITSGLRFAQSEASAGKKGACASGDFQGYIFDMQTSSFSISIACTTGNILLQTKSLEADVTAVTTPAGLITFSPLAVGTGSDTTIEITHSGSSTTINISSQGNIE